MKYIKASSPTDSAGLQAQSRKGDNRYGGQQTNLKLLISFRYHLQRDGYTQGSLTEYKGNSQLQFSLPKKQTPFFFFLLAIHSTSGNRYFADFPVDNCITKSSLILCKLRHQHIDFGGNGAVNTAVDQGGIPDLCWLGNTSEIHTAPGSLETLLISLRLTMFLVRGNSGCFWF